MPHAIWNGSINFGLVNIPVSLYSSENKVESVSFHQIDTRDNARIKYLRINAESGKEVPWEKIGKAYQYDKELLIPVKEGELQNVAGENARTIAIESFVDKKNLDYIMVYKTYYLVPEKAGYKGYVILREALQKSGKMGIAKLIIGTREYLGAVSVLEDALVVYLLRYANEIQSLSDFSLPEHNISKYKVNKKEIEVAKKLIQSMTVKWNAKKYKDEFKQEVHHWLERKLKHLPMPKTKRAGTRVKSTNVVNFVDLLKKSMHSKKSSRNDKSFKVNKIKKSVRKK